MNKPANNKDYEELFQIYIESSCACNKKEDDDEDKETEDTVEEETEDVVEEGLYSRTKARASGAKGAAGSWTKGVGSALLGKSVEGDVSSKYNKRKVASIINSHVNKLDKMLSSYATDLVKLGLVDEDVAEKIASRASSIIKTDPNIANLIKRTK